MFNKSYKAWTTDEDSLLNKLYNNDQLDIMEIYEQFERSPGSIISRLKKHGWITNIYDAKGYKEYQKSSLYKTIKNTKKKDEIIKNKSYNISDLQHDLMDMKNELYELKNLIINLQYNKLSNEDEVKKDIENELNGI